MQETGCTMHDEGSMMHDEGCEMQETGDRRQETGDRIENNLTSAPEKLIQPQPVRFPHVLRI